ncbi:hypothetical protein PsAD2_03029 [Pseudovibrio axinellae]|uniref:Uncharacterized protein n=1 Tax=Pseudovibrio axinellae TaxID=989403 RepID=A0A165XGT7_9HYPH|nr:hypothetical protein [Pseudovibrio axinellae]KZL17692.1 hypothetical protein PsAD2_03029 [Pseudovibrio axinellae]SER43410.1 hypothetical protein SAMN05421798_11052 [Pseudovibrio axinellae]
MSSFGFSTSQPELNSGWENTTDCILTTLKAELGSYAQRRDWGCDISKLIDKPQHQDLIVDFYFSIALALQPRLVRGTWYGEPRFHLENISIDASVPAKLTTILSGIYFPLGHLGSFERAERKDVAYSKPDLLA